MPRPHDTRAPHAGAPLYEPPRWLHPTILILAVAVLVLDLFTPPGMAVGLLYIAPVLVAVLFARRRRVGIYTAAACTVLILLVDLTAAVRALPDHAAFLTVVNRILSIAAIWLAGLLVSRYRQAQDAASANRLRASAIEYALDQSAIVAFTDARGRITHANDQFCAISGYSRDELLGQDHRLVNSAYHPREFMQDLWRTIGHGGIWRGEIRNRRKDGQYYWVDTTIVPLLDGQGKPQQYLAIRFDITSRKAAEARLLEQASLTQLGELAAVVAHEVRNPLAGLRGSLQVLASRLPAEMREKQIIGTMIERIDVLNDKVQDLLLFARPRPPRPAAVDLRQLLADVAASSSAAVRPSVVNVAVTGTAPAARADAEMLREVLLNVTLNACQASPEGQTVDVRLGTRDGRCEVVVSDRGPGIPPDVRDRLFTPFFTTKRRGTGLGLAIVKRLLELQDGTIALESAPGGGTTATITLPLHEPRQPPAPRPQEAAVSGTQVSGR